jgi:hypothetical protein
MHSDRVLEDVHVLILTALMRQLPISLQGRGLQRASLIYHVLGLAYSSFLLIRAVTVDALISNRYVVYSILVYTCAHHRSSADSTNIRSRILSYRWLLSIVGSCVHVLGGIGLLNTCLSILFAVATADVRQLIRICLSVHAVGEWFSMGSLVHWRSSTIARHTRDSSSKTTDATTNWALLNWTCLWSYHVHSSSILVSGEANRRTSRSLIRGGVINSIMLGHCSMLHIHKMMRHICATLIEVRISWINNITDVVHIWDGGLLLSSNLSHIILSGLIHGTVGIIIGLLTEIRGLVRAW